MRRNAIVPEDNQHRGCRTGMVALHRDDLSWVASRVQPASFANEAFRQDKNWAGRSCLFLMIEFYMRQLWAAVICLIACVVPTCADAQPARSILVLEQSDVRGPFYAEIFA